MQKSKVRKKYLVLIHGLRGTHHGLLGIADKMREEFEVLVPDLPGSGENPELDDKTLDGYAGWLHEYCSALPEKPYIVGHSMGSIVVSYYVQKYPEDTQAEMVLMAPIFRSKMGKQSSKILYGVLRAVLSPLPQGTKHKVMASRQVSYMISHFLTYDKRRQKEIDELHYEYSGRFASAESLMADAKISMMETAMVPDGKRVLLCVGTHDRLVDAEIVKVVAEKKGAEYREMADVGHLLNYERPAEVARVIQDFLRTAW